MTLPYVGMPNPQQMPQQQMILPPFPPPRDMTIEILGAKIPAELLSSGAFWCFFLLVIGAMLLLGYFKYCRAK